MKYINTQFKTTLLVLVLASIIAPHSLFAETMIENNIIIESTTGSNTSSGGVGAPGEDSGDGKDGVDGQDGKDGDSIITGDKNTSIDVTTRIGDSSTPDVVTDIKISNPDSLQFIETIIRNDDGDLVVDRDVTNDASDATSTNPILKEGNVEQPPKEKPQKGVIITIIIEWFKKIFSFSFKK